MHHTWRWSSFRSMRRSSRQSKHPCIALQPKSIRSRQLLRWAMATHYRNESTMSESMDWRANVSQDDDECEHHAHNCETMLLLWELEWWSNRSMDELVCRRDRVLFDTVETRWVVWCWNWSWSTIDLIMILSIDAAESETDATAQVYEWWSMISDRESS